jgi:hypothetical protein
MVSSWTDSLAKYDYSANLSHFLLKNAYPGGYSTPSFSAEINRTDTRQFENAFRTIITEKQFSKYSIIGEVCFWKTYTKPDPHSSTKRILNHIKYQYNFQKFCSDLHNLAMNSTLDHFQKFRLSCGQPNGFAIPITFLSFYQPDKYPMADAITADWWNKNKDRFGYSHSPEFHPPGMISGFPEFIENNWNVYRYWVDFCQEYAGILTQKTHIKWRARDVEMAVFFNHQKGVKQLSSFEEKNDSGTPQKPECTVQKITSDNNSNSIDFKRESRRCLVKGLKLKENDLLEDAYVHFNQATIYDPNNLMAWFNMAYCLQKKNKYSDAMKCYTKILDIDPNDEEAKLGLSNCSLKLNPVQKSNLLNTLQKTDVDYSPKRYDYWSTGVGPKRNLYKHSHGSTDKRKS